MAKDILKEAIADAKAVREVALANAKAALEEAFTPRLQSMLSAKLSEELNEEEDLDENKEEIEETYTEETVSEEVTDLDEEIDLEEILNELELEEGEDSKEETVDEAKEDGDDKVEEAKDKDEKTMDEAKDDEDTVDEAKGDEEEDKLDEMEVNYKAETANRAGYAADYVHEGNENFDLDALLEEINNLDETEEESMDEILGYERDRNRPKSRTYNDPHSSDADIDYWKQNSEGQTNEVAALGVAAGVAGLVAAAGGLGRIEMAADDPEFAAKYPKVARALKMMQGIGKSAADTKRHEEVARDEELAETKAALEAVQTELNEVNLLNSKLLYVNRIFKSNNLNEAQKLRVVETLDNASNVKEAKLIYETIKDTFTVAKSTKTTPKRSIKEGLGMASKAAGTSTAPKKAVLNESNDMVTRMQKLANIKISQ
jgi:hypothetical protein